MALFGLIPSKKREEKDMHPVDNRGGWFDVIREPFTGAWQRNKEERPHTLLSYHAVFACITLIASDIAKMRINMIERGAGGIKAEVPSVRFNPVLRKPNEYQTRIQFMECWMNSKLSRGNAYIFKEYDNRGVVKAMHVLDPDKVKPLISDDGSVYYQLGQSDLAEIEDSTVIPARFIIHDRFNCLFHPLVGLSPLFANGLAATQGLKIQGNSSRFFENMSRPSGILIAPGAISDETAKRLKEGWETNYSNGNIGRVAVVGDDLKYQALTVSATDSQLVEQLQMTSEIVASVFHVPAFKIGFGNEPTYANIESRNQDYYSQCLQILIESIEACLDDGLGLKGGVGTEFDLDALIRMDTASMYDANNKAVGGGWMAPNEARRKVNLPPVEGGDSPLMQQQNYSLEALARRDESEMNTTQEITPSDNQEEKPEELDDEQRAMLYEAMFNKELRHAN